MAIDSKPKCPETVPETAGMLRWLLTYADMITLLLAMFILLYAEASESATEAREEALAQSLQIAFGLDQPSNYATFGGTIVKEQSGAVQVPMTSKKALYTKVSNLITKYDIKKTKLIYNERGVLISFVSSVFFEPGSAKLRPRGEKVLDKISMLLKELKERRVIVEGHTDSFSINNEEYPTNWELSSLRSVSVVRYFIENKNLNPARFSATGYAEYWPFDYRNIPKAEATKKITREKITEKNLTPEDRENNRRIEILIPHQ